MGMGLHNAFVMLCKTCTETATHASHARTGSQQVNANVLLPNGFRNRRTKVAPSLLKAMASEARYEFGGGF